MITDIKLAMLWSDWLIYGLLVIAIVAFFYMKRRPHLRDPLRQLFQRKVAMIAAVILACYALIGLLDSIHFDVTEKKDQQYSITEVRSLFDLMVSPLGQQNEKTYSAPFSLELHSKEIIVLPSGEEQHGYPRLVYGGAHLSHPSKKSSDIAWRIVKGLAVGIISFIVIANFLLFYLARHNKIRYRDYCWQVIYDQTVTAWRAALTTFAFIWLMFWVLLFLSHGYHILGTDKVGNDVFYETIKSIRTGLLIGTLTTLFILPLALFLGMLAGFFGGIIDDIIQYLYTTLSSIPGVLLIAASILVLQVYISSYAQYFPTLAQRADARLLALCFILGITSWANLCRLLRGETLKLREQEFVQAARVMGVSRLTLLVRHIMPNITHIVLITLVLDFSGLVLAEAVLSYVGVGVDPTTMSWGNMINSSRLELAREPVVWWPLLAALMVMFVLVLAANLFADAVRDALDPHLREIQEDHE